VMVSPTAHTRKHVAISANVSNLIVKLNNPSIEVRLGALKSLSQLGSAATSAVPAIINALNENRSIGFGTLSKRISPAITDAVLDALKSIGPGARNASPYLVTMLVDHNELLRRDKILEALNSTGLDDSATKTVIEVTREEGKLTNTRLLAIRLLGEIEPPASEAREILQDIMEDHNDKPSRTEAAKALSSIDERMKKLEAATGDTAGQIDELRQLRNALDEADDADQRIAAIKKVGALGEKGNPFVPRLIQILNKADCAAAVKLETMKTLGYIGTDASAALPALIANLMDEKDELDRGAICRAIAAVDPEGQRVLPLITPALDDPFKARIAIQLLDEIATGDSTNLAQKARDRWHIK
jgi:HEAT repeats/PBS lyase HEAT-like repeat